MNFKTRKTSHFFNNDYVDYASYDNIRKIPSLCDGQKNAARKILWYVFNKKIKNEIKVSQLDSKVAEETEYLHGTMAPVIVNLAQDYTGTNNINLLEPEGNFGTKIIPEASAARYIYTYGSNELFTLLSKQDIDILEHQEFEGHQIEPKFLLPSLPMLLVNGAEGISSGFATKILPRNPDEIKKYIKYRLTNPSAPEKPFKNKPWYRGFNGVIEQGEEPNKWVIKGAFTQQGLKVNITELPIGYSLKSYLKILDTLEDQKKIKSYKDNTNKDFRFEVYFTKEQLKIAQKDMFVFLKLQKKVTENYTVINEDNRVKVFDSIPEIFEEYIKVKMLYLEKRKNNIIKNISEDIKIMISKYIFIKSIVNNELVITKRPTIDIIKDLDSLDSLDKVIKQNGDYNYLLNMNIQSLTQEKMNSLLQKVKDRKSELDIIKNMNTKQIWLEDLKV